MKSVRPPAELRRHDRQTDVRWFIMTIPLILSVQMERDGPRETAGLNLPRAPIQLVRAGPVPTGSGRPASWNRAGQQVVIALPDGDTN